MKSDFSISLGDRIRYFRTLTGMSQVEFSELIGCDPSTLAHYETGKNLVSMTKLKKISEVLNIEPYKFFITNNIEADSPTIDSINKLLLTADKVQLGLIYNILKNILDLTSN